MNLIESVLVHNIIPPRNANGAERHPALVMLHGRGADENDLLGLAEYVDPRLFILSARAPYPFAYGGGYAWYDILGVGKPEPTMHRESYRRIMQLIEDAITGYSLDPQKIFLYGFSMGSMMSFTVSLAHPEKFAGVIANSGYIPEETDVPYQWDRIAGSRFFVAHGTYDPVVPVEHGRRAKELLEKTPAHLEYHEYPMGHEISPESLAASVRWLTQEIDRTP